MSLESQWQPSYSSAHLNLSVIAFIQCRLIQQNDTPEPGTSRGQGVLIAFDVGQTGGVGAAGFQRPRKRRSPLARNDSGSRLRRAGMRMLILGRRPGRPLIVAKRSGRRRAWPGIEHQAIYPAISP